MSRAAWAVLCAVAVLNLTVACGRSWPRVRGVADQRFAVDPGMVDSVDVLPVDVDIAVSPRAGEAPNTIARRFYQVASQAVLDELARRGYAVGALVQWTGAYVGPEGEQAVALAADEVVDTARSLAGYGYAQQRVGAELLAPYLPVRLGVATGSDTTLYVGGWAYVGKKRTPTSDKVLKGILIGTVVLLAVAIVIAALDKSDGGVVSSAGRAAGAAARGAGKAVTTVVRATGRVAGVSLRAVGRTAHLGARAAGQLAEVTAHTAVHVLDCFGRAHTHIELYGGDPHAYQREIPHRGEHSRLYLEMTLVDNASGATLWHARQLFEDVSAAEPGDVQEAVVRMLQAMPSPVRPRAAVARQ